MIQIYEYKSPFNGHEKNGMDALDDWSGTS